jgi:hypothetical protein
VVARLAYTDTIKIFGDGNVSIRCSTEFLNKLCEDFNLIKQEQSWEEKGRNRSALRNNVIKCADQAKSRGEQTYDAIP